MAAAVLAGSATRPIIGRRDRWAYISARVRNEITHIGENSGKVDGSDLFYLSESVFDVVRICMLQHLGVPADTLKERSTKYAVNWYKEHLQEGLGRLREWTSTPQES